LFFIRNYFVKKILGSDLPKLKKLVP